MNPLLIILLAVIGFPILLWVIRLIVRVAVREKLQTYKQFMKEEEKDGKRTK